MSAIYQTLKKLGSSGESDLSGTVPVAGEGNDSLRRRYFSPKSLMVVSGFVLTGFLALFICHWLDASTLPIACDTTHIAPDAQTEYDHRIRSKKVFRVSLEKTDPAGAYSEAGYTSPIGGEGMATSRRLWSRDAKLEGLSTAYAVTFKGQSLPASGTSNLPDAGGEGDGENLPEGYSVPEETSSSEPAPVQEEDPETNIEKGNDKTALEDSPVGETGKADGVSVTERSDVLTVISRIESAISAGDMNRAKTGIAELAQMKGNKDIYVLKVTAFVHMRKGDMDQASRLLSEVLARKPNDVEAGINMAVVEITSGEPAKARERLLRLREVYPSHEGIGKLVRRLGG